MPMNYAIVLYHGFLFLREIKNFCSFQQDLRISFEYNHIFRVDPCGQSGDLAIFYMDDLSISILYADKYMILKLVLKDIQYDICTVTLLLDIGIRFGNSCHI